MDTFIFGAGGHAAVISDIFKINEMELSGFIDDNPKQKYLNSHKIFKYHQQFLDSFDYWRFIVAIGDNQVRKQKYLDLLHLGGNPINVIHPKSICSDNINLGLGIVIMGGAIINHGVTIGQNVILNSGSIIEHHCSIQDHCHICPGVSLAGNVCVGEETFIGTGTAVIPGVTIGDRCVVGAGSVVIHDLPSDTLCYGNPCKVIRSIS